MLLIYKYLTTYLYAIFVVIICIQYEKQKENKLENNKLKKIYNSVERN